MKATMSFNCNILIASLFFIIPIAHTKCDFEAIFNFGDSNSDTGGFWAAFPAQPPPFGITFFNKTAGRASDGRLVIDFLAQALGFPFLSPYLQSIGSDYRHGANFATLASTVLLPNTSQFVTGVSPFSLAIQLNQMKELQKLVVDACITQSSAFSRALYTIDIGQNDFTGNLASIGIKGVKMYLPHVASQIASTIKELYMMGGRTFFVMNLAPIGCYPAFIVELPHLPSDVDRFGCLISYNNAVVDYNKLLKKTLRRTRDQLMDASVVYVDTHSVKLDLYRRPKRHGLLYGTRACCGHGGGEHNFDPRLYCGNSRVINGVSLSATACCDPEKYVSWDGIHATEAANEVVAKAILQGSYFDPPFALSKLCHLHPID